MKKYILSIVNLVVVFGCFVALLFSHLSENVMYLMVITLVVGSIIPYLVLLITGIEIIVGLQHAKMSLVFNVLNVFMCILDLYFSIKLFDKKMIVFIISYSLMGMVSLLNVLYFAFYIRKNPDMEKLEEVHKIKEIKEKNNGAIV